MLRCVWEEEISFQLAVVVQGSIPFANSWRTSHHQKNYIGAKIRVRDRNFFLFRGSRLYTFFPIPHEPVQSSAEDHTRKLRHAADSASSIKKKCRCAPRKAHQTNSLNLI